MNYYGITDTGLERVMNQDVFYTHKFSEDAGFAIVCDGMGGENAGHIASAMVCDIITKNLIERNINLAKTEEIRDIIVSAISEANVQVYSKSGKEPEFKGMGTTVVLCVIIDSIAYIAHIGDSRLYYINNNKLTQVTRDHSRVQELFEQGKINKDEVRTHPQKNIITRAVGVYITVDIDFLVMKYNKGAKFLLCSDGLTNMVNDMMIEKILLKYDAETASEKFIELANKEGGVDNITVAIIE